MEIDLLFPSFMCYSSVIGYPINLHMYDIYIYIYVRINCGDDVEENLFMLETN